MSRPDIFSLPFAPSDPAEPIRTVAEDKLILEKSHILKASLELSRRGARRGCLSGPEVGSGSRLCKNSGAETFRATIESGAWLRRIIIATKAKFLIQYFVSVSRKSFLHSLGHERKSSMGHGMSGFGGEAEVDFGRLDVCL